MLQSITPLTWAGIICLFFTSNIYAQKNFTKGYIVLPSVDTIQGFVDDQNWTRNPNLIYFKGLETNEVQKFGPGELKGFYINTGQFYISRIVTIDKTPITLNKLLEQPELKNVTDTVFLKILVTGPASLYYLLDQDYKPHYFLHKPDIPVSELIQRKFIQKVADKSHLGTSDIYKGQLMVYFSDCSILNKQYKNLEYREKELIKFIQQYNKWQGGNDSNVIERKTLAIVDAGLLVGGSSTELTFSSQYIYPNLVAGKFNKSLNYVAGGYLDIIKRRNQKKWSLHNELAWRPYQVENYFENIKAPNNYEKGTYQFAFDYLGLTNMIRYTWPSSRIKPFLNVGIAQNIAISNKNILKKVRRFYAPDEETTGPGLAELRKYEQALVAGAGVAFHKICAEIRFENGNGMSPYSTLKSIKNMWMIGLSYRLYSTE